MNLRRLPSLTVATGLAVVLAGGVALLAYTGTLTVYDNWQSGNAAFECSQIGNYTYALKLNEANNEGAPNGSETANFYDQDNNLVHSNTITIKNSDGKTFDWEATNSIGAVIVKAGQGANVFTYNPQAFSDTGLFAYENRDISHVTFCWNPDQPDLGQWCSPGYWRQSHHLDSWEATGYSPNDYFGAIFGYFPKLSKQGVKDGATPNPTLWQVLQSPQWYGGDAFNAVGDLLSAAHPDVNFSGNRVEDSCPLD